MSAPDTPANSARRHPHAVASFLLTAFLVAFLAGAHGAPQAQAAACRGEFPDPVGDVCWSCIFPLTFGDSELFSHSQEDFGGNPDDILCACSDPPRFGVSIGFWEPVRMVEVVRDPWCFAALGGLDLDPGVRARVPTANRGGAGTDDSSSFSFYHAHWYVNPLLHWLQVLLDSDCIERQELDLAYLTELDPSWGDDSLAALLAPEAYLSANLPATAACAADCVAANAGFPRRELFWCAGCQGKLYPLDGNVSAHVSGRQASSLLTQRMAAKMHRQFATWSAHGPRGACGYWFEEMLDRRTYKYSMLYPKPQTEKLGGRCCQPFGRSTAVWAAASEWPIDGEDFVYLLFRKRNCCSGAVGL